MELLSGPSHKRHTETVEPLFPLTLTRNCLSLDLRAARELTNAQPFLPCTGEQAIRRTGDGNKW